VEDDLNAFTAQPSAALILSNRYDGIDLPDDDCRLVVLAGRWSAWFFVLARASSRAFAKASCAGAAARQVSRSDVSGRADDNGIARRLVCPSRVRLR
jgi:hypothetical protein